MIFSSSYFRSSRLFISTILTARSFSNDNGRTKNLDAILANITIKSVETHSLVKKRSITFTIRSVKKVSSSHIYRLFFIKIQYLFYVLRKIY